MQRILLGSGQLLGGKQPSVGGSEKSKIIGEVHSCQSAAHAPPPHVSRRKWGGKKEKTEAERSEPGRKLLEIRDRDQMGGRLSKLPSSSSKKRDRETEKTKWIACKMLL